MSQILTIQDQYSIKDAIKNHADKIYAQKRKSPFIGMVRVYENGVLNTDQSEDGWLFNMTVAAGREFANQCIFKKANNSSVFGDISNYKVDSFSVGSNGSSIDNADNITLLGPNVCDLESTRPVALNPSCFTNRNGVTSVIKKIESTIASNPGSITQQISTDIEFTDCANTYFTITKNTCIIESGEPTDLQTGDIVKIDEAFLYATHPDITIATSGTIHKPVPFAHICFAPKFIEKESVFIIEWFIIF